MGFWNTLKDVGSVVAAPVTGGMSLVGMNENARSRIPIIGGLTGAQSDAEKALLKKQEQMATEAARRQRMNEQTRLNGQAQQLQAFGPRNQVMAQMFGPDAAFTPQQFAQMGADPGAISQAEYDKARQQSMLNGPIDPRTRSRQVGAPMPFTAQDKERMLADQRRQAAIAANMQPLPQGPAPLRQVAPQAGRRY